MYDQTDWNWLANLTVNQLGTGIYLLPVKPPQVPPPVTGPPFSPSSGPTNKLFQPGITYDVCKQNACRAKASVFRWVPETIASFTVIQQTQCPDLKCTDTCVTPGCICDPDIGQCV